MKKIFVSIFLLFLINISIFAQLKDYKKLRLAYDNKQYEKCVDLSAKYIKKSPKELMPIYYCSKANFELFNQNNSPNYLKQSLKYVWKLTKTDKKQTNIELYADFKKKLHLKTKNVAYDIYSKDKNKAKPYYDYLAKIYQDTLAQFYEFHPEYRKSISAKKGLNQNRMSVNKLDKSGKKQGFWTKKYKNGVVAYEVYFKDDKPVGTHKRYHQNGKLMAKLVFDDKGEWTDAELFNDKAMLIAKGKYKNKKKEGLWTLYKDSLVVGQENYTDDKKNGVSKTFYITSGKIAEEKHWKNGLEDGMWRQYHQNGKLRLEAKIIKGVRNSTFIKYHDNGRVEIKGAYKNDKMNGVWIYYDRDGKEQNRTTYKDGKAENQKELDKKQKEYLDKLEQNKGRIVDPAKYINNPNEYFRKTR